MLLESIRRVGGAGEIAAGGSTAFGLVEGLPDEATTITRRVARDDAVSKFLDAVDQLDKDDRRLVIHCGIEGEPYHEVATRMGLSRDAVAKRWQRLRAQIAQGKLPTELLVG